MRRHLTRAMVRFNGWPRRLTAAACLLMAAASAVRPHAAARGVAGIAVVVAARDLAVGTTLGAGDVRLARWPAQFVPAQHLSATTAAMGRRLSSPLARGEPVTLTRVVGAELTAGLDSDHVAATVTTATDVSSLVHPGDRVDLLAAPSDAALATAVSPPASVVARDVQVLAVLGSAPQDGGTGTTLVVATLRSTALVLAGLVGSRLLAVMGRSP